MEDSFESRREAVVTDYVERCAAATTSMMADMLALELARRMPYLRLSETQRVACMVAILEVALRNDWRGVADLVLAKSQDVAFLWSRVDSWSSPERVGLMEFVRRKIPRRTASQEPEGS